MAGWHEAMEEAQALVALQINGADYPRIGHGLQEREHGMEPPHGCHDCHVKTGQLHIPGCDMEKCPRCGGQIITCDCDLEMVVFECGCRDPIPDSGGE